MLKEKIFHLGIVLSYITAGIFLLYSVITLLIYVNPDFGIEYFGANYKFAYGPILFLFPPIAFSSGIVIFLLTYFGLRRKEIWVWFTFLVFMTITPIAHFTFQIKNNLYPFNLYILLLGIPAMALTGPAIFSKE